MYSPSKAAVRALTEVAAIEFAPLNIRVNAVGPGRVTTEGNSSRTSDPAREQRTAALIPAGRLGVPDDVADVVSFFASSDSRYTTGQILYVDGGLMKATIPFFQAAQNG
jgi:NAD(P)-dependent dehydrogenase (short-subunit alcohol dehydrogenase family)